VLPFLHNQLQQLLQLLEHSSIVLKKYNQFDLDLSESLIGFLDGAITTYQALNLPTIENEMLLLKAQFVSAQHGTHPLTLERVNTHKRELIRAITLRLLQQSSLQLRTAIERAEDTLNEGRAQLRPLVLLAMQKGLITQNLSKEVSQQQLDDLWRGLLNEPDLQLAARQISMQLSPYDIQLLLAELINAAWQLKV
jgi:hypothetical protein